MLSLFHHPSPATPSDLAGKVSEVDRVIMESYGLVNGFRKNININTLTNSATAGARNWQV